MHSGIHTQFILPVDLGGTGQALMSLLCGSCVSTPFIPSYFVRKIILAPGSHLVCFILCICLNQDFVISLQRKALILSIHLKMLGGC